MPVHIYPFYKVSDEIKRPWIPVRIVNNKTGDYTDTMALLDTGADHCVFQTSWLNNANIIYSTRNLVRRICKGWEKIKLMYRNMDLELSFKAQIGNKQFGRARI